MLVAAREKDDVRDNVAIEMEVAFLAQTFFKGSQNTLLIEDHFCGKLEHIVAAEAVLELYGKVTRFHELIKLIEYELELLDAA